MPRKNLKEYSHGDPVDETFLLAEKQLRANRNADLYLLATLRDRSGQMNALMWNVTEEAMQHFASGDFVHVKGKVQLYQGGLQMIITHITPVDAAAVNTEDFHPETSQDTDRLLDRLREILLETRSDLRALIQCFFADERLMKDLAEAPAGVKAHHAYPGGLLEHVVSMLEVGVRLREVYTELDIDLLLVGILLHDLGKVREMAWETSFVYTDEGQLVGHMPIAVEMLTEKVAAMQERGGETLSDETIWRLKHMIVSHHGSYEFGSSRLPMTPEAIALHYIDNLDAKIHEFTRAIENDPDGDSHWTPYSPRLQRKLFKGADRSGQ